MYRISMKVQTAVSIDDDIKREAKELGLNISAELENALKKRLGKKVPAEVLKLQCAKCGAIVDKGYICRESRKAWCIDCHKDLNIAKVCFNLHKFDDPHQKVHFHARFGDFEIDRFGQTLKDIEQGNPAHNLK